MTDTTIKSAPAPKTVKVAKSVATPSVEKYGFRTTWTGPSDAVNKNLSRTKIDPTTFNKYPKGAVTERDQAAIVALRHQFGYKEWARKNMDAGIVRRLMERGLVRHASGDPSSLEGKFALTKAGMGAITAKAA